MTNTSEREWTRPIRIHLVVTTINLHLVCTHSCVIPVAGGSNDKRQACCSWSGLLVEKSLIGHDLERESDWNNNKNKHTYKCTTHTRTREITVNAQHHSRKALAKRKQDIFEIRAHFTRFRHVELEHTRQPSNSLRWATNEANVSIEGDGENEFVTGKQTGSPPIQSGGTPIYSDIRFRWTLHCFEQRLER